MDGWRGDQFEHFVTLDALASTKKLPGTGLQELQDLPGQKGILKRLCHAT